MSKEWVDNQDKTWSLKETVTIKKPYWLTTSRSSARRCGGYSTPREFAVTLETISEKEYFERKLKGTL